MQSSVSGLVQLHSRECQNRSGNHKYVEQQRMHGTETFRIMSKEMKVVWNSSRVKAMPHGQDLRSNIVDDATMEFNDCNDIVEG